MGSLKDAVKIMMATEFKADEAKRVLEKIFPTADELRAAFQGTKSGDTTVAFDSKSTVDYDTIQLY